MYPVFTAQPVLLDAFNRGETRGFAMFGPEHLAWLAACVVLIALLTWRYVRLARGDGRRALWMLRGMAAVVIALLASEDALMIAASMFWPAWWPLHLCNFAEFFCVGYAIRPNRACRELLLTVGLTGSPCALLFPGWSYCPAYTWPVICGFVEHSLIFALSLCALSDWRCLPRWRDLGISLAFLAVYVIFFRWFNVALGANFGFVTRPAEGSPMVAWEQALGNPGYLVPYLALFVGGMVLFHAVVELQRRKARRRPA